jgi:hypothetical protein
LIEDCGYTYNVKRAKGDNTDWQCRVCNKTLKCPGSVVQVGNEFYESKSHPATKGSLAFANIMSKVKDADVADMFRSATSLFKKR